MGFNRKVSGGKEYYRVTYDREIPQSAKNNKNIDTSDPTIEELYAYVNKICCLDKNLKEKKIISIILEGYSLARLLLNCLIALIPYLFWNKLLIFFFPSLFPIPLLVFVILLSLKRHIKAALFIDVKE